MSTTYPQAKPQTSEDTDRIVGSSKLLGQMRDTLRRKHYSIRTEYAYFDWVKRYILHHNKCHPNDMGNAEITQYLNHLAVERQVAASTQNQALNAIVFLYKQVLERKELNFDGFTRAKRPEHLPVVFDRTEVAAVINEMQGIHKLLAAILYGAGLRILESLRLRIQDIEFERNQIVVRQGKGAKDRVTLLPQPLIEPIRRQMTHARQLHQQDLANGLGEVYLPYALARKYPNAAKQWNWQYLFPANDTSLDPRSGKIRRHHVGESSIQKGGKKGHPSSRGG